VVRLALRVRREDAELALAELLALAPSGVEELDVDDSLVEFAVYGAPGELPELPDLQAAAGSALIDVSTTELPDDWGERWKRFHRPIVVPAPAGQPALRVRPPWEPPADLPATKEIVIDPGQAFGTGAHHTTRMCLELLLELASRESGRGAVVDVGCGSGVLAIAAAQLGFAPVLGLDHESESVQATHDNAKANGVDVDVQRFDLRREPPPAIAGRPAPILLANLVRPLLLDLAASLADWPSLADQASLLARPSPVDHTSLPNRLSPADQPRHLIASGLLREEADEIVAVFHERFGLHECERRHSGEWAAVWLSDRR
jgi:ribosomal protein L11 methyltransferase